MAKSFGGAILEGGPVVMTSKEPGYIPGVMYWVGKEAETLELLDKMGIIKRVILPKDTEKPPVKNS